MADYKSDKFKPKQRSYDIRVLNQLNAVPVAIFSEEIVVLDGTTVILGKQLPDTLQAPLDDMSLVIPKLNPLDDSVIGTMTVADAHIAFYSVYRYFADQRDAALIGV